MTAAGRSRAVSPSPSRSSAASTSAGCFAGFARRLAGVRFEPTIVNGQPGALMRHPNGDLISVLSLEIEGDQVSGIRSIINPEKLQHLQAIVGPLADLEQIRTDVLGKQP